MKRDIWKETHWDTWTLAHKVRHVIAVILSLLTVLAMILTTAYMVLVMFGLHGFILHIRDTILLDIMHSIFG